MADFNSNSPTLLGLEWRPQSARTVTISNTQAIVQRIRGSAVTPANLHAYISSISGAGVVCWELCTTPIPTLDAPVVVRPGTLTGDVVTGTWTNAAGGALAVTDVNDNSNSTYAKNTGATAVRTDGSFISGLQMRGGGSALTSGVKRVVGTYMSAQVWTNSDNVNVGIVPYTGVALSGAVIGHNTAVTKNVWNQFTFATDFVDNMIAGGFTPWTTANLNTLLTTASGQGFGIYHSGVAISTNEVRFADWWLTYQTCPENRLLASYAPSASAVGWKPYAWSGPEGTGAATAMSANTWYYLVLWCGSGSMNIPLLKDVNLVYASSPSASTGEQRQASVAVIGNSGIVSSMVTTNGEMAPFLMEAPAATIHTQSQPYAVETAASGTPVYSGNSQAQQITSAGGSSYSSVKFAVAWQATSTRPDQPMTIELRHGVGAATGGGTLDAIGTLGINDVASGAAFQDVTVQFTVPITTIAAQYYVYFRSGATNGKGWALQQLDTADNVLTTTTTAQVEGATIGGTTDAYSNNAGTAVTRYDLAVLLAGAGTPPAGVTVVAKVAA